MSTTTRVEARAPKRQRGRLRVAAILAAGADVFRERGYDAATMTEIAARSKTAIGSLYRFFPAKEALADALLHHYLEQVLAGLEALRARADGMDAWQLAEALVDFALRIQSDRRFATALIDMRGAGEDRRAPFRRALHEGVAAILHEAMPDLPKDKAAAKAALILHVLKALTPAAAGEGTHPAQVTEVKILLRAYLGVA